MEENKIFKLAKVKENLKGIYEYVEKGNKQNEEIFKLEEEIREREEEIKKIEADLEKSKDSQKILNKIHKVCKNVKITNEKLEKLLEQETGEKYKVFVLSNQYFYRAERKLMYEVGLFLAEGEKEAEIFENEIEKNRENKLSWALLNRSDKVICYSYYTLIYDKEEAEGRFELLKNTNWVNAYLANYVKDYINYIFISDVKVNGDRKVSKTIRKVIENHLKDKFEEKE